DGVDRLRGIDDGRDELSEARRVGLVRIALTEDVDLFLGLTRARRGILRLHGNGLQYSQPRPQDVSQQTAAPVRSHSRAPPLYIRPYIASGVAEVKGVRLSDHGLVMVGRCAVQEPAR